MVVSTCVVIYIKNSLKILNNLVRFLHFPMNVGCLSFMAYQPLTVIQPQIHFM